MTQSVDEIFSDARGDLGEVLCLMQAMDRLLELQIGDDIEGAPEIHSVNLCANRTGADHARRGRPGCADCRFGAVSAKLVKNGTLKVYPGLPYGMCTTNPT